MDDVVEIDVREDKELIIEWVNKVEEDHLKLFSSQAFDDMNIVDRANYTTETYNHYFEELQIEGVLTYFYNKNRGKIDKLSGKLNFAIKLLLPVNDEFIVLFDKKDTIGSFYYHSLEAFEEFNEPPILETNANFSLLLNKLKKKVSELEDLLHVHLDNSSPEIVKNCNLDRCADILSRLDKANLPDNSNNLDIDIIDSNDLKKVQDSQTRESKKVASETFSKSKISERKRAGWPFRSIKKEKTTYSYSIALFGASDHIKLLQKNLNMKVPMNITASTMGFDISSIEFEGVDRVFSIRFTVFPSDVQFHKSMSSMLIKNAFGCIFVVDSLDELLNLEDRFDVINEVLRLTYPVLILMVLSPEWEDVEPSLYSLENNTFVYLTRPDNISEKETNPLFDRIFRKTYSPRQELVFEDIIEQVSEILGISKDKGSNNQTSVSSYEEEDSDEIEILVHEGDKSYILTPDDLIDLIYDFDISLDERNSIEIVLREDSNLQLKLTIELNESNRSISDNMVSYEFVLSNPSFKVALPKFSDIVLFEQSINQDIAVFHTGEGRSFGSDNNFDSYDAEEFFDENWNELGLIWEEAEAVYLKSQKAISENNDLVNSYLKKYETLKRNIAKKKKEIKNLKTEKSKFLDKVKNEFQLEFLEH
jgi:hypothetical protein